MKTVALVLAVVCFAIAIAYWLPNGIGPFQHHVKHGILFAALGLVALAWMRLGGGSTRARIQ